MILRIYFKILFLITLCTITCDSFDPFGVIAGLGGLSGVIYEWRGYCEPNKALSLKNELEENLFGQHIVIRHIVKSVTSHMNNPYPRHALSLVFAGPTGTGKNLVSSMIAKSIHDNSNFVHIYSGRLHFPLKSEHELYVERTQKEIVDAVSKCSSSVFIFDEIDKIPTQVLDGIRPFLDHSAIFNNVDFRKAIFIFLTNVGALSINVKYMQLYESGVVREKMTYGDFESALRGELFESEGLFHDSSAISHHVISLYLPFLPLERNHVELCIRSELKNKTGSIQDHDVLEVMKHIDFHKDIWSLSGCRRVADIVEFIIN